MTLTKYSPQRSSPRTFVVLPVYVDLFPGDPNPHMGVIRDISQEAIFFFSTLRPPVKSQLAFTIEVAGKSFAFTGKVLRVQDPPPGGAVGIAVSIQASAPNLSQLMQTAVNGIPPLLLHRN